MALSISSPLNFGFGEMVTEARAANRRKIGGGAALDDTWALAVVWSHVQRRISVRAIRGDRFAQTLVRGRYRVCVYPTVLDRWGQHTGPRFQ